MQGREVAESKVRAKGNVPPSLIGQDAGVKSFMQPQNGVMSFIGNQKHIARGIFVMRPNSYAAAPEIHW